MSNKVIEQKDKDAIRIEDGVIFDGVKLSQHMRRTILVEDETRTTVAKAIDPEYQKVIDERDGLKQTCNEYSGFVRSQTDKIAELEKQLRNVLKANTAEIDNATKRSDEIVIKCNKDYYKWSKELESLKQRNAKLMEVLDAKEKQVEFFKKSATNLSEDKNKIHAESIKKDEKIVELVRHKENLLNEVDSLNKQLIDAGLKKAPITKNTRG
jgi:chromosome segregation ATPase